MKTELERSPPVWVKGVSLPLKKLPVNKRFPFDYFQTRRICILN